jgi:hypothetical protein
MSDDVITVRLPQRHAAFLQANLSHLAIITRQAMTQPGLRADRRTALGIRAFLLETIEDAVHGALLEPNNPHQGRERPAHGQPLRNPGRVSVG